MRGTSIRGVSLLPLSILLLGTIFPTIKSYTLHVVSLPAIQPDQFSSIAIRELWKWKDVALGDGRDFFVPRPRAIATLNANVIRASSVVSDENDTPLGSYSCRIEECAVLSNCARLDVYVLCEADTTGERDVTKEQTAVKHAVASCLAAQLDYYKTTLQSKFTVQMGLSSLVDSSDMITSTAYTSTHPPPLVNEIASQLLLQTGSTAVTRHACMVTSGLAPRPSRPDRTVQFRPFSSRDAHIMLQMKRTVEVCDGNRLKLLLDASLQTGKAVRDVKKTPAIRELKQYAGEGRYATQPPAGVEMRVTEAVMKDCIEPGVQRCVENLRAMECGDRIAGLRKVAESYVAQLLRHGDHQMITGGQQQRQRALLQKLLHQPTCDIRAGKSVDETELLKSIRLAFDQQGLLKTVNETSNYVMSRVTK